MTTLSDRLRFCADQDGVSTDTHNELIECAEIVEEMQAALNKALPMLSDLAVGGRKSTKQHDALAAFSRSHAVLARARVEA